MILNNIDYREVGELIGTIILIFLLILGVIVMISFPFAVVGWAISHFALLFGATISITYLSSVAVGVATFVIFALATTIRG